MFGLSKKHKLAVKMAQQGIEESYENSQMQWRDEALKEVYRLASELPYVSSEEVIENLRNRGIKTHNNSAMGAVMQKAKKNGWIVPSHYRRSARSSRHMAPVMVWRSNIAD